MHRFFADKSQFDECSVRLEGDDVRHITRVLRLREGDKISVCDKDKTDFICTLTQIGKDFAVAAIDEQMPNNNESPIRITLYQGLPKGDKMDLIVRMAVELGAVRIVPVEMKRTVVRLRDGSAKASRWQRIADEASKQCMRGIIPEVEEPLSFDEMLSRIDDSSLTVLAYENERSNRLMDVLRDREIAQNINIIIGPEGGFDEAEVASAVEHGAEIVTLGPRIMRCETAPLAAIAAVMYEAGDW